MWRIFYSVAATIFTVMWGIYFSFTRRYIGVELGGGIPAVLLITGLEWMYVLFAVLAGRFSRSIGKRSCILIGSLGAVPIAASAMIRNPLHLAVVLSLNSLTWSLTWPIVMTAVFAGAKKGFGKAYSLFTVGTGFGFSLGSAVMGLLYYAGGPTIVLFVCSALYAVSYTIFYVFYPESSEVGENVVGGLKPPSTLTLKYLFAMYALLVFCREAYYSVAPVKLSAEISKIMPEASGGSQYIAFGVLFGGLTAFLTVPMRLAVGFLVDKYDPRLLLGMSFALYTTSYWLFILLEGVASIAVWQLPLYPLVDTSVNVLLAKNSAGDGRTRALGTGLAISAIGGLGVLPLIAYPEVNPFFIGVLIIVAAICGLAMTAQSLLTKIKT